MIRKVSFFKSLVLAVAATGGVAASSVQGETLASPVKAEVVSLQVHKSPTCGCCGEWVDHAEHAGLDTQVHEAADMGAVKDKLGIKPRYQSCHTAVSEKGGYFFEGHVPAKYVQQFLKEKPENAAGLAVPGMPMGSPGMEMGGRFNPYKVYQINRDGSAQVYATVTSPEQQY